MIFSTTLCHGVYHTGIEMEHGVLKLEKRVWRSCAEVLCFLKCPKKSSEVEYMRSCLNGTLLTHLRRKEQKKIVASGINRALRLTEDNQEAKKLSSKSMKWSNNFRR